MTYQEALQYLDSFIDYEKIDSYDYRRSFNLDRMRDFALRLGDPHKGIRSIHIAGSKGKGSTASFIYSILRKARFKVGIYTSPHLVSFRERIMIDDELISAEDVSRLLEKIKKHIGVLGGDRALTFFEVYTALAYLYFKEKRVDFAVYETGLGGRLDATNIIEPLVCAITPISYEHTQKLGNTLGEIAAEKAGIIKERAVCVSAPQEPEAMEVIERVCVRKNVPLIRVGEEMLFEEVRADDREEVFNLFGLFGEYPMLRSRLLGSHQMVNAATAIGCIEALRYHDIFVPPDAVSSGIESARWGGRLEVVERRPFVVLDGAQNRASAAALALSVKKIFRYKNLILVLGVSKDKDIKGISEELLPMADSVVLTQAKVPERASEPSEIEKNIGSGSGRDLTLTSSVEEALDAARRKALAEDLILVTGSLFVVGEARACILQKP